MTSERMLLSTTSLPGDRSNTLPHVHKTGAHVGSHLRSGSYFHLVDCAPGPPVTSSLGPYSVSSDLIWPRFVCSHSIKFHIISYLPSRLTSILFCFSSCCWDGSDSYPFHPDMFLLFWFIPLEYPIPRELTKRGSVYLFHPSGWNCVDRAPRAPNDSGLMRLGHGVSNFGA